MAKTSIDWLELTNNSANPIGIDSVRRGLCFVGAQLKVWSGNAWADVALTNSPILITPTINGTKIAYVTKSAGYTMSLTDFMVTVDATGAAVTITLPAASGNAGLTYVIKKIDSSVNNVVIDGNAAETIDGVATVSLSAQYEAKMIVCDGTNWFVASTS